MNEKQRVFCNRCACVTIHSICAKEEVKGKDDKHPLWWYDSYEILKCDGCLTMCSKHTSWFSEDCRADGKPVVHIKYYPQRSNMQMEPDEIDNLPTVVKKVYHEAIGAYNAGLKLSCAAALRAILEAICSDKQIKGGQVTKQGNSQLSMTLEGKINGLQELGFITAEQAELLHEARFLGNDALHEHEVPTIIVLLSAIDIIEHMLISIYEIKDRAKELIARRQQKAQLKSNIIPSNP